MNVKRGRQNRHLQEKRPMPKDVNSNFCQDWEPVQ